MKKFIAAVPKAFFAILCYLSAILLAILSGYFTIIFYSNSQSGWNMWAMGGLAGMLEFIKMMLAAAFPFMQYRDDRREKKVMFYLRICFFLSIMASMNFFMSGGVVERSPASKITELIYSYVPLIEVIPLKFAQFITTMSLSILIEAFIIFLPILAPIMFLKKDYSRKKKYNANTNFEKIKEIVTVIPDRFIDKLYKKVVGSTESADSNIRVVEAGENKVKMIAGKPNLRLIKIKDYPELDSSNPYWQKENEKNNNENLENTIDSEVEPLPKKSILSSDESITNTGDSDISENEIPLTDNETHNFKNTLKIILGSIYKLKENNLCPSVKKIINDTGINEKAVYKAKKEIAELGILKTTGTETEILVDEKEAFDKLSGENSN